jgi:hypothetical protein
MVLRLLSSLRQQTPLKISEIKYQVTRSHIPEDVSVNRQNFENVKSTHFEVTDAMTVANIINDIY